LRADPIDLSSACVHQLRHSDFAHALALHFLAESIEIAGVEFIDENGGGPASTLA
jgi:hypothetical protein